MAFPFATTEATVLLCRCVGVLEVMHVSSASATAAEAAGDGIISTAAIVIARHHHLTLPPLVIASLSHFPPPSHTPTHPSTHCSCALNAASTCTWNALDCLSTESFPTSLRTTAMGLLAASGRIGSIAGQFIFGGWPACVMVALLVVPRSPGIVTAFAHYNR